MNEDTISAEVTFLDETQRRFRSSFARPMTALINSYRTGMGWGFDKKGVHITIHEPISAEERARLKARFDAIIDRWKKKGVLR